MDEEINYKTLRKIQEIEKNSPILSELKQDFYNELKKYLKNLYERLDSEKSTQKKLLIADEIENIKKIGINIYEHREKKILLAAVSKARGGSPDLKNILKEEKVLFDSVYEFIMKLRETVLEKEKIDEDKKIESKELKDFSKKEKIYEVKHENKNPIIRITQDIPEFIGLDGKKYNLKKNDILSLQENMSNLLINRKVAEKVEFVA